MPFIAAQHGALHTPAVHSAVGVRFAVSGHVAVRPYGQEGAVRTNGLKNPAGAVCAPVPPPPPPSPPPSPPSGPGPDQVLEGDAPHPRRPQDRAGKRGPRGARLWAGGPGLGTRVPACVLSTRLAYGLVGLDGAARRRRRARGASCTRRRPRPSPPPLCPPCGPAAYLPAGACVVRGHPSCACAASPCRHAAIHKHGHHYYRHCRHDQPA